MTEKMSFDEWIALPNEEQDRIQREWNPYAGGYWNELLAKAEERFRQEFGKLPDVLDVTKGTYHGGTLIIGVTLGLPLGRRDKQIPERFAGFHVQQFWASKTRKTPNQASEVTARKLAEPQGWR